MESTQLIGIHAYDNSIVDVPLFTLLQWRSALKLEARGMKHSRGSVAAHVRKFLKVPKKRYRDWGAQALCNYLQRCIDDIDEQLGVK
jgi:hypothetical protein